MSKEGSCASRRENLPQVKRSLPQVKDLQLLLMDLRQGPCLKARTFRVMNLCQMGRALSLVLGLYLESFNLQELHLLLICQVCSLACQ